MKLNGTSSNIPSNGQTFTGIHKNGHYGDELVDELGDDHGTTSIDTPMRDDAFALDDDLKIDLNRRTFSRNYEYSGP